MRAAEYAHLYKTTRWQRIRAHQLAGEPLCRMCAGAGRVTAATVCDHVTPHKGDVTAFHAGPFQSLCKTCHDGAKAQQEATGHLRGCDAEGVPFDQASHWR